MTAEAATAGAPFATLDVSRAWLVDPASGREGPGEVVVRDGILEAVTWLEGAEADGIEPDGIVVAPGFIDLHAHFREPGFEDAETIASGAAAAAHGGFTTVCLLADTQPSLDDPAVLGRVRQAALASGSPIELLAYGAVTAGRSGEQLAALGELADAGVVGFSDDPAPLRSAALLGHALVYAAMVGLPVVDHASDDSLAGGAEAAEGPIATVLGLRGAPAAAEEAAVARDLAVLASVLPDAPGARLHLAHLSTAAGLDLVRRAKAAGLPVTCDVTPHHVALTDEWLAGARRWSWEVREGSRGPWVDGALVTGPYASSLRVDPPLRPVADALACLAALADGTADAMASDHAPWTIVDKEVEFGLAAAGIAGIETALGVALSAVAAGHLTLARAVEALTTGPAGLLGDRCRRGSLPGLLEGAPADLVVFDRGEHWEVNGDVLHSRAAGSPLLGRSLPGRVLLTVAAGRIAYQDERD
jgi:dihydroorotase